MDISWSPVSSRLNQLLDKTWLAIRTLLVQRRGQFMVCNVYDACMHTDPCSHMMHTEKREQSKHIILLCQIKMQIEKCFESYPTLYTEQIVSFICAPIWAPLFGQDSICRHVNVS
jgi:hypothetical protein